MKPSQSLPDSQEGTATLCPMEARGYDVTTDELKYLLLEEVPMHLFTEKHGTLIADDPYLTLWARGVLKIEREGERSFNAVFLRRERVTFEFYDSDSHLEVREGFSPSLPFVGVFRAQGSLQIIQIGWLVETPAVIGVTDVKRTLVGVLPPGFTGSL